MAEATEKAGRALFSETIRDLDEATLVQVLADAPTSSMGRDELREGIEIVDLLVRCSLAASRGEARRFVDQGGVYINNAKFTDERVDLSSALHDRYVVVRRGRRQTHLLVLS